MSGFFDGVYGAKFPDVVMNSGPLPPNNGTLPAPLHATPDGRINYNSTLLGDITPYAYGEPAYLSSQHSYLNIPHRIQKLIPVVYLPEPDGKRTFRLSHGVDDGDVAFNVRLNKTSLFCTGSRNSNRRTGLGTNIDSFINLPTLNYILAGVQLHGMQPNSDQNSPLWNDFLHALDHIQFPELKDTQKRNYATHPLTIHDIVHIIEHCIRPFGIMRGSEKQGGQNEMTQSPAQWPVPFVGTFVVDGREDHVVNMWHHIDVDSGEDLVLRLKPMPLPKYTLNHYYKQPIEKFFPHQKHIVWQLVPDKMYMEKDPQMYEYVTDNFIEHHANPQWLFYHYKNKFHYQQLVPMSRLHWQELGYWHIGRTQIRMHKYNIEGGCYYHNDMVNMLRSQYMLMTYEPVFYKLPFVFNARDANDELVVKVAKGGSNGGGDGGEKSGNSGKDHERGAFGKHREGTWALIPDNWNGKDIKDAPPLKDVMSSDWTIEPIAVTIPPQQQQQATDSAVSAATTTEQQQPAAPLPQTPSSDSTTTTTTTPTTTGTGLAVLKKGAPLKRTAGAAGGTAAGTAAAKRTTTTLSVATTSSSSMQGVSIHEDGSVDMHRVDAL